MWREIAAFKLHAWHRIAIQGRANKTLLSGSFFRRIVPWFNPLSAGKRRNVGRFLPPLSLSWVLTASPRTRGGGGGGKCPTFLLFPPERGEIHGTIRRKNDPLSWVFFAPPCKLPRLQAVSSCQKACSSFRLPSGDFQSVCPIKSAVPEPLTNLASGKHILKEFYSSILGICWNRDCLRTKAK